MNELKLWLVEDDLNETYWVIAESEDEAYNMIKEVHKENGFFEDHDVEPIDYYEIEKRVIRINS